MVERSRLDVWLEWGCCAGMAAFVLFALWTIARVVSEIRDL